MCGEKKEADYELCALTKGQESQLSLPWLVRLLQASLQHTTKTEVSFSVSGTLLYSTPIFVKFFIANCSCQKMLAYIFCCHCTHKSKEIIAKCRIIINTFCENKLHFGGTVLQYCD